jgi:hypothetical protein
LEECEKLSQDFRIIDAELLLFALALKADIEKAKKITKGHN